MPTELVVATVKPTVKAVKMRYAQLVMGPAGSGKSTYCTALAAHAQVRSCNSHFVGLAHVPITPILPVDKLPLTVQDAKRTISVVNLDPAAEFFNYQPLADIRDLIQVSPGFEPCEY